MNNNGTLKSILAAIVIAGVYAYARYTGGSPQSAPAPQPHITYDKPAYPDAPAPKEELPEAETRDVSKKTESSSAPKRDLEQDERHHGHTLQRHIGRTDEQLLERLKQEPDISSASTYTDRDTAERTVGAALEKNKAKIDAWIRQGPNRPNLAFDFHGDSNTPIGRSIHHGGTRSEPVFSAKVVLKADGDSFHVLTSYPEAR